MGGKVSHNLKAGKDEQVKPYIFSGRRRIGFYFESKCCGNDGLCLLTATDRSSTRMRWIQTTIHHESA